MRSGRGTVLTVARARWADCLCHEYTWYGKCWYVLFSLVIGLAGYGLRGRIEPTCTPKRPVRRTVRYRDAEGCIPRKDTFRVLIWKSIAVGNHRILHSNWLNSYPSKGSARSGEQNVPVLMQLH